MLKNIFHIVMAFIFVISLQVKSASFDCKQAKTKIEVAICVDDSLSKLDELLANSYKEAMEISSDKYSLSSSQKSWLTRIRSLCKNNECIIDAYKLRQLQLLQKIDASKSNKDIRNRLNSGFVGSYTSFPCSYGSWLLKGEPLDLPCGFSLGYNYLFFTDLNKKSAKPYKAIEKNDTSITIEFEGSANSWFDNNTDGTKFRIAITVNEPDNFSKESFSYASCKVSKNRCENTNTMNIEFDQLM